MSVAIPHTAEQADSYRTGYILDPQRASSVTPAQCRAARAYIRWGQDRLAERSEVAVSTIRNFEAEKSEPQRSTLAALQRALEDAGIEFLPDGGVRLRERD